MGAYCDVVGCGVRTGALVAAATLATGGGGEEMVEKGVTPRAITRPAALRRRDGRGRVKPLLESTRRDTATATAPQSGAGCRRGAIVTTTALTWSELPPRNPQHDY
jgi:hypothetical protein